MYWGAVDRQGYSFRDATQGISTGVHREVVCALSPLVLSPHAVSTVFLMTFPILDVTSAWVVAAFLPRENQGQRDPVMGS